MNGTYQLASVYVESILPKVILYLNGLFSFKRFVRYKNVNYFTFWSSYTHFHEKFYCFKNIIPWGKFNLYFVCAL